MAGSASDFAAVSQRGNGGVDRFYNSAIRREQHHQQQQHHHQKTLFILPQHQQMLQRMEAARRAGHYPPPPAAPPMLLIPLDRNRSVPEDPPAVALPISPSVSTPLPPPPPPQPAVPNSTNLELFLESVIPLVAAKFPPPVAAAADGKVKANAEMEPFFHLSDLWNSFQEWSAYGVEVPTYLKNVEKVDQYYVPFLSGIQLYVDPDRSRSGEEDGSEEPREAGVGGSTEAAESSDFRGLLVFEYLEHDLPYDRKALFDKIGGLASQFPVLKTCRSCDLLPSSWIGIAWYPIYRIPVGNTLRDLETAFLTLYHLSTHPTSQGVVEKRSLVGTPPKIALPVSALASYKLKGSLVSPGPREQEQENSMVQAFTAWLEQVNVRLPDFHFFRNGRRYQMT